MLTPERERAVRERLAARLDVLPAPARPRAVTHRLAIGFAGLAFALACLAAALAGDAGALAYAFLGALVATFGVLVARNLRWLSAPVERAVVVVLQRSETELRDTGPFAPVRARTHTVTFERGDASNLVLAVDAATYARLDDGAIGVAFWCGDLLWQFRHESEIE